MINQSLRVEVGLRLHIVPSHKDLQRFHPVADGFDRLIDEQTAKAFALADNRTSDLGSYDTKGVR